MDSLVWAHPFSALKALQPSGIHLSAKPPPFPALRCVQTAHLPQLLRGTAVSADCPRGRDRAPPRSVQSRGFMYRLPVGPVALGQHLGRTQAGACCQPGAGSEMLVVDSGWNKQNPSLNIPTDFF